MIETEFKKYGNSLSSDELHALIMSHMLNNNLNKLRIYAPDGDESKKIKLFIYKGRESGKSYVEFILNPTEN
jgi:hypothetical protein